MYYKWGLIVIIFFSVCRCVQIYIFFSNNLGIIFLIFGFLVYSLLQSQILSSLFFQDFFECLCVFCSPPHD